MLAGTLSMSEVFANGSQHPVVADPDKASARLVVSRLSMWLLQRGSSSDEDNVLAAWRILRRVDDPADRARRRRILSPGRRPAGYDITSAATRRDRPLEIQVAPQHGRNATSG